MLMNMLALSTVRKKMIVFGIDGNGWAFIPETLATHAMNFHPTKKNKILLQKEFYLFGKLTHQYLHAVQVITW